MEEQKTQQLNIYTEEEQKLQELESSLWKANQLTAALEERLKSEHGIDPDQLSRACSILPWNYNYEVPKTIDKILTCKKEKENLGTEG